MTAEEALAWVEDHDVEVTFEPDFPDTFRWSVGVVMDRTVWVGCKGSSLPEAVTRLKAKLEAR